ncbi:hypothetical protein HORM4_650013 [Vibrio harveyi]|nr:hypothetical protein HORM4_650013 [Vibrio harveyi]
MNVLEHKGERFSFGNEEGASSSSSSLFFLRAIRYSFNTARCRGAHDIH